MLMFLSSCSGIFYPKIYYDIVPMNGTPDDSISTRFNKRNDSQQEIVFAFSQPGNSFKKKFITSIFVKKPYKDLFINKISYVCK